MVSLKIKLPIVFWCTKHVQIYNFIIGEKYWKDPKRFDPDRFLDELGHIKVPEAFIPFSVGNT